jgi:hypothetical protein
MYRYKNISSWQLVYEESLILKQINIKTNLAEIQSASVN